MSFAGLALMAMGIWLGFKISNVIEAIERATGYSFWAVFFVILLLASIAICIYYSIPPSMPDLYHGAWRNA